MEHKTVTALCYDKNTIINMKESIYRTIQSSIINGRLDKNFELSEDNADPLQMKWMPGALDGIYVFHMHHGKLSADDAKQLAAAVKTASRGHYDEAEQLFAHFTEEIRAVYYFDQLQCFIITHSSRLNAQNLHEFALRMILCSHNIECVKTGLEIMTVFTSIEDDIKNAIRTLGLYDEFTLFAVWNMLRWDSGNEEIFKLARSVDGWGRIHAVDYLEPDTEEIRHWLLTSGTINRVMYSYSSLTCWNKSQAEKVLFGKPSQEEFTGISILIDGLLDEGPAPGISELENAGKDLLRFVNISSSYHLDIDDYDTILSIKEWSEDKDHQYPSVSTACKEVLSSCRCISQIKDAVEEGMGFRLADALGIPFHEQLFACMKKNFDHFYYHCNYLMDDPAYIEPTLDLFRKNLLREPLADASAFKKRSQYSAILQLLRRHPLAGADLVNVSLKNTKLNLEKQGLIVLKEWVISTRKKLNDLSPGLYQTVNDYCCNDSKDENAQTAALLVNGAVDFPEGANNDN